MLNLIVCRRGQSLDRLRLDAVDLGLHLRDFLQRLRRKYGLLSSAQSACILCEPAMNRVRQYGIEVRSLAEHAPTKRSEIERSRAVLLDFRSPERQGKPIGTASEMA